jgi:XTP/dITP diphosphohydrolase
MELVFATHNKNKFEEVKKLLPTHFKLLSLDDIRCTKDIKETADTIEGNAILKANYIKDRYGYDCFADDTGLEVDALNGEPGVFSARYAGKDNNADLNIKKLLDNLSASENRNARFKTAIALNFKGSQVLFLGICDGTIRSEKRGEKGFGYDPVFQPNGFQETFAEMTLQQKNNIGHRGKAMRQLIEYLSD